jgi:hypothetical protein
MEEILRLSLITVRHEPIADSQLAFSHSNCRRRRGCQDLAPISRGERVANLKPVPVQNA